MASPWADLETYTHDLSIVATILSEHLREGSLSLCLGAGVSAGVGLPAWWELVARCQIKCRLSPVVDQKSSNDDVRNATDTIESQLKKNPNLYRQIVADALYETAKIDEEIVTRKLLIALGAMMMGSRRGSIRDILTFNFDDVLEWYLGLHGFTANVVSSLPYLQNSSDVTVYHAHGFLPRNTNHTSSDSIIFSQLSYDQRLGAQVEPWKDLSRSLFLKNLTIFVGLSGDDPELAALVADVAQKLAGTRPVGFWLLGPHKTGQRDDKWFLHRNIVPLRFSHHDEYPRFLMNICQRAAVL